MHQLKQHSLHLIASVITPAIVDRPASVNGSVQAFKNCLLNHYTTYNDAMGFSKHMKLLRLIISTTTLFTSVFLMPVKAKNFAWSCIGSQAIGSSLRITGTQEPGADIVKIRNSSDGIVMTLAAVGPVTEEVISNVGRNGEDGIIRKRVYADNDGKRWIYKNLDAHPSFQSAENSKLYISCFP